MKRYTSIVILLFCASSLSAQGFDFKTNKARVTIPFKLVSNLIIIPIEVNGVELNFLLDSGVEETVLFSLEDKQEVKFFNVEKIMLRGLGSEESIEALKSTHNTLKIRNLQLNSQDILIVIDETMDFSSSLGIPVNGIIGYRFFQDNIIEINYSKRKLYAHRPSKFDETKRTRKFTAFDMSIEKNKPYIDAKVSISSDTIDAKLLLDTGNSDAVWLFTNKSDRVRVPEKNFHDFLGRGFSGEIFGRKARIKSFEMDGFMFRNPIVSFPDTLSLKHVKMVENRLGSIGSEVLRRFILIFNYKTRKFFVKKNDNFALPFNYNMSGIEIHHAGLQMVHEEYSADKFGSNGVKVSYGSQEVNVRFKFELKPVYAIASVRPDSPAARAGLKKGDIIKSVDSALSYKYSLQQINEMLRENEGHILKLLIARDNVELHYKILLENVL